MAAVRATLRKDRVLVPDEKEANALYNKGAYGVPQSGGGLALDLVEALYLVEHNRLAVEGHDVGSLLRHASGLERDLEIRYVVYRDLRNRTFTVKPSNVSDSDALARVVASGFAGGYHVYARGALPGKSASTHLVRCVSERESMDAAGILDEAARAKKHGKLLLVALVDEEGDLTYYEATEADLRAHAPPLPGSSADAFLLEDRVAVLDKDQAAMLHAEGWFGRDVGIALQLSLPEAVYLSEEGRLRVREADGARALDARELAERAARIEPDFALRLALYRALRANGVVVKTGFKFGTHFRAYHGAPDETHSPYLVHAVAPDRRLPWPEVAGFVRLAHGVRKRLFFAVPSGPGFRLLELARRKP